MCGLLLSHVFAFICFWLSFLLYYLDNCVCYLVLQSLDQPSCCPVLNSLIPFISLPSRVRPFGSAPPSRVIALSSTVRIRHPSRTILVIKSSSVRTPVLLSQTFRTFVLLSQTYFRSIDVAQYLTQCPHEPTAVPIAMAPASLISRGESCSHTSVARCCRCILFAILSHGLWHIT